LIRVEQELLQKFQPASVAPVGAPHALAVTGKSSGARKMSTRGGTATLPIQGETPELSGANWLKSPPVSSMDLRGQAVLVDFWTSSCIRGLSAVPYAKA
jgi:hypothetical protein